MKKKITALALSLLLVFSVCALAACNSKKGEGDNGEKDDGEKDNVGTVAYVSLDINPAIELIVDKDNKVVSVRGENEDGQVLLYEETDIVGESLDKAVQRITDLAVQYGYLDENNKVVDTVVTSDSEKFTEEILSTVNASVTVTAKNLGLNVTTDTAGAYSLLRRMEEVKKEFPNNAAIQNMSVAKFKLVLSVSENGDISIEAAAELDEAALIEMLKEANSKIEEFATATYSEAKAKALAAYDQATELASYGVYTQYYIKNVLSHPTTVYYGGVYQMYASAAKGFEIICDAAERMADIRSYPMNEAQVNAVVAALGLESSDPLKNSDGEVTVESIEAYADKLFKNTPASEALEQKKAALTEALAQAESDIKVKVKEFAAEYKPQIEAALASARQIINSATSLMPDLIKEELEGATEDLNDILNEIETVLSGDKIEIEALRAKAKRLDTKANEYLDKIKADLSEEEWAALEAEKADVVAKMTEKKAELEKALDDAEREAKEYLKSLKEARKNK